jgi:hypothetical protein
MTTQLQASVIEEADIDQDLNFTRNYRKQIVQHLFKSGVPDNPDDLRLGLTALADMDKSSLGIKRLKVEEKANATQEAAAGIISQLLMQAAAGGNQPYRSAVPVERELPLLGNDIPEPILVPGETSTEIINDDFDSFMARTSLPRDV